MKWLKEKALKDKILDAAITERLDKTPAILAASSFGWSGNMQRIMEAQAYKNRADSSQSFYAKQKKKFEINPRHPLIRQLNEMIQENEDDEAALNNANLLFDTAVLQSNYDLTDKAAFADRILGIMYQNLGVAADAEELDADEYEEEVEFEDVEVDEEEEVSDEFE